VQNPQYSFPNLFSDPLFSIPKLDKSGEREWKADYRFPVSEYSFPDSVWWEPLIKKEALPKNENGKLTHEKGSYSSRVYSLMMDIVQVAKEAQQEHGENVFVVLSGHSLMFTDLMRMFGARLLGQRGSEKVKHLRSKKAGEDKVKIGN
jgi:hypothetical protein